MGCFNTTCFASMQTIKPGERCYVIPIVQNLDYGPVKLHRNKRDAEVVAPFNSTCYPNAFWEPVGRPILAVYDDYGTMKFDEQEWNLTRIKNLLSKGVKQWYDAEEGENSAHDLAFELSKIDLEKPIDTLQYVWEAAFEQRVFWADYQNRPCMFTFAVVCEYAYKNLIEHTQTLKGWDGKSLRIKSRMVKIMKEVCDGMKLYDTSPILTHDLVERFYRLDDGRCPWSLEITKVIECFRNDILKKFEVKEILTGFMLEKYFHAGLTNLNIRYIPMVYAPQDYSNELGREYKKFVNKTCAQIKKDHDFEEI